MASAADAEAGYAAAAEAARAGAAAGKSDEEIVHAYVAKEFPRMCKEPAGMLQHPYMVPSGFYSQLWDCA